MQNKISNMEVIRINKKKTNMDNSIKEKITPLIPRDDLNIDIYKDALDYALDTPNINNIAITSPYGGGKSSVIKSYDKQSNSKYKFIYVPIWELECEKNNFSLEKKIIRHLNIKKNQEKDKILIKKIKYILQGSIIVKSSPIITLSSILYLVLIKLNIVYIDSLKYYKILNLITFIFLIFTGIWVIGYIDFKKIIKKINVEHINLGGLKLNIPKKHGQTLIDENQEKILEILDSVVYDNSIIVFEDIDRYNDVKVFSDLRELNYLANIQKGLKIKFVYLIRDDIFKPKEKSKFFDLIIPVIPAVDSSNSFDYLESKLKGYIKCDNDLDNIDIKNELIDTKYLFEISIYLDEIRLINHIINEFFIYAEILEFEYINYTQLFSIIVYKNLLPKNFQKYHTNKNYITHIFNKIDDKRKEKLQSILDSLEELHLHKSNSITNIEELASDIVEEEESLRFYKYCEDKEIFSLLTEDDYSIFDKTFDNDLIDEIEKNKKLLIYLFKNGYISKTSENYIATYDKRYLSSNDIAFYKEIIEGIDVNFRYRLSEPNKLIELLDDKYLERKSILNFDIINELIIKKDSEKINIIFKMIADTRSIDFLNEYINVIIYSNKFDKESMKFFLTHLHDIWDDFFNLDDIYISSDKYSLSNHLSLLFYIFPIKSSDLGNVLKNKKLKQYIEENIHILNKVVLSNTINRNNQYIKLSVNDMIGCLRVYNYKFSFNDNYSRSLINFKHIYYLNMYRYDTKNLLYMLNIEKIKLNNISELRHNKQYLNFWEYTQSFNNFNVLLNTLLDNNIKIIFNNESDYIYILNKKISDITKERLIHNIDIIITDIGDIYEIERTDISNKNRYNKHMTALEIVKQNKLKPTLSNVICLYRNINKFNYDKQKNIEMLDILVKYLNINNRIIEDRYKDEFNNSYSDDIKKLLDNTDNILNTRISDQFRRILYNN